MLKHFKNSSRVWHGPWKLRCRSKSKPCRLACRRKHKLIKPIYTRLCFKKDRID